MDLKLKGKKALVTAASEGLGYACARMLAAEGVDVALSARRADKLETAAQEIAENFSVKAYAIPSDMADAKNLATLAEKTMAVLGDIDILVISTGHPPTYPFSIATDTQWMDGYNLILQPAIHLPRAFLPAMQKNKYGRIIFIGSIFGLEAESGSVIQSTLRRGLNGLMKCVATEYAKDGITANVICPGYFDTPLVTQLAEQYATQENRTVAEVLEDWKTYAPIKAFGMPDDLGAMVAFLASPRGTFVTGTTITMDGGAVREV